MKSENIILEKGSKHHIVIENMAAAGYNINYTVSAPNIVSVEEMETTLAEESMTGGPVQVHFCITALRSGQAAILFTEAQEWDDECKPIPLYELNVTVSQDS